MPRERLFEASLLPLPLAKLGLHLATATGYGIFRDELYYLACAEHPAWGYVDHPALSILALKAWTAVFGTSLISLRFPAALLGALTVLLVGLLARRLGGGRGAAQLAMLATLCAPIVLGLGNYYSMNAFDLFFWALAYLLLAEVLLAEEPVPLSKWLLLGAVLGLGLQNKISVLWLGAGLGLGLVVTARRRLLATPGPWLCGLVAMAGLIPYVLWNLANGSPTLEFMKNATGEKMARHSALEFARAQLESMGPAFLLALAGALWLLLSPRAKALRPLGVTFAFVWALLAASSTSRPSYATAAYAVALAAGAVAVFEIAAPRLRLATVSVASVLLVAYGVLAAPSALPVLSVDAFIRYQAALGQKPGTDEKKEIGDLPQHWADRQGWPETVDAFETAWETLSPEERKVAKIFASDYGVAGAIDYYGPARGLPKAISGHNNYFLWGPGPGPGSVVLVHTNEEAPLHELFSEVTLASRVACGRCMPYENGVGIYVCKGPKMPIEAFWPRTKNFS